MIDVEALVDEILREFPEVFSKDKVLHKALSEIVKKHATASETARIPKPRRRTAGLFDPMTVYRESADELRTRLTTLKIEQLKDIVAEHGMDRSKLAMKWKAAERLVELIMTTVASHNEKGDAFRKPESEQDNED